jgi:mRNA interferase MazF
VRSSLWQRATAMAASHDRSDRQSGDFAATASLTVCLLTSHGMDAPLLRLPLRPDSAPSWIMVDKIVTVPRAKIGRRLGSLSSGDVTRLNRALAVFLGIAGG